MQTQRVSMWALAFSSVAFSTAAADVLDLRARVEGTISGQPHLETAGPSATGSLFVEHQWAGGTQLNGTGQPIARSALDDMGRAAALADAFPSAPSGNDTAGGSSAWTFTITNTSSVSISYLYVFEIHGPTLEVYDINPPLADAFGYAGYGFQVRKNGADVIHSHANLDARDRHVSPTGTFVLSQTFFSNGPNHTGVHFGDLTGEVPLGELSPSESMTIEVQVEATVQIGGTGVAARAQWGDAQNVGEEPGVQSAVVPDAPVTVHANPWSAVKLRYR